MMATAALAAILAAAPAVAAQLKQVGTIAVPGTPLGTYDISFWDQSTNRYYLADRTNKSLDIFDGATEKFITRVPGFVGQKKSNDNSGPDGVVIVGNEAFVGDGDSTVKVIDLQTKAITDTISTGGKARSDESSYDPDDQVILAANNADDPPFAAMISTKPGHKLIAKITFPNATNGAEASVYDHGTGMFYQAVPQIGPNLADGGIAVIDPKAAKLVKIMPVKNCQPSGLAHGPGDNLLLGCTAGDKAGLPPVAVVMNFKTGAVVQVVPGPGGNDMVAYNPNNDTYYTASRDLVTGPVLGVIDAKTNMLTQSIKEPGGNPHTISVNGSNNHVYLPLGAKGGGCGGCVAIYSPE